MCLDFINDYPESGSLYFHSKNSGSGKSSMAVAMTKELITQGKTKYNSYFYVADDLFEVLRENFLKGISLRSTNLFRNMMKSDIIIIDDLGIEKLSKFIAERYFYLMNAFWNEKKKVIITSKFDIVSCIERAEVDVDQEILESLVSRMKDMFTEVEFSKVDYRRKR